MNGQTVTALGIKVDPWKDQITVNGKPISLRGSKPIYIILNKPPGVLSTTHDARRRQTVLDLVNVEERLFPVGRLDLYSEGLILLTNDGDLTQKLTHPSFAHERAYHVLVSGKPNEDLLRRWRAGGFIVDGKPVAPMQVEPLPKFGSGWLRVTLKEGRKRQIREVAAQLGLSVITLQRVRFGTIKLGSLKTGKWRYLTTREIDRLKKTIERAKQSQPET